MGVDPRHPSQWDGVPARFKVLRAIDDLIEMHGYSPTFREIGFRCGLTSSATVQFHIARLLRDKLVTEVRSASRTIRVTEKGKAALEPKE